LEDGRPKLDFYVSLLHLHLTRKDQRHSLNAETFHCRSARPATEVEPQLTLRGHSAAITRLIHSPAKGLLYSASLDSSIRIWALPGPGHTTYGPYDHTRARGELIGHTDAVWDLTLARDENTLVSCGAEGAVKVWDVGGPSGGGALALSWGFAGLDVEDGADANGASTGAENEDGAGAVGCTAIEAIKTDIRKVAVAYAMSVIKVFDIETGKELSKITSESGKFCIEYPDFIRMVLIKLCIFNIFRRDSGNADQQDGITPYDASFGHCA
jgi:hypothetical protein